MKCCVIDLETFCKELVAAIPQDYKRNKVDESPISPSSQLKSVGATLVSDLNNYNNYSNATYFSFVSFIRL